MTEIEYVWVVECDCYESQYVEGVYASIEAAIAANPVPENARIPSAPSAANASRPGGWQQVGEDYWSNGLDWSDAASARRMPLLGKAHS